MDVEKDIDAIYKRLNNIDKRLVEIESTRPFLKEMVDRNVSICELLGETMQEVQYSMRALNEKMELQSTSIKEIREEFNILSDRTNDKIDEVSNKIQLVEDKGKFDILQYIKNNWPLILVLIGYNKIFVDSNEYEKEKQYISYNIENTRDAYGINIEEVNLDDTDAINSDEVTKYSEVANNISTTNKDLILKSLNGTS